MARALIVIDIQQDYFPGGVLPLWQTDETEARIIAAMGKARAAGDKIILIRHVSTQNSGLFADGGTGNAIRPAILEASGDAPVVVKHFADAFQDTDLATHLDGVDDLLICGMMTQNCVVFTALSEAANSYEIQVIGDLCTAPLEVVHLIALNAIGSKRRVVNASDVWS
ncbi:isochorismatase family protein [Paracoccus sp. 11-3]|uniref:Isochorismatase family protein n=1 Tax=Paracoccus amoyensis TaxID=2760093 RepID=A0A926GI40_9RHOB|nr:isochorismatase family protein [Paracoccus amoyensis]MBC9247392.1 isochorismatase family protein [Paracoccus amoyensis]